MKIAVASGKGGTGKTTIATSLALSLAAGADRSLLGDSPLLFLDCDVEEPNAHLFLKPQFTQREDVVILIPQVDQAKCNHCGWCAEVCQYHAIAALGGSVLVFPQLCHGCGSCTLNCPKGAIREVSNVIGTIENGPAMESIAFAHGMLNVGEPMATPVIRRLKQREIGNGDQIVILDAPPGTSCPVGETPTMSSW
jgi:MinD superfamily P-loop ATPase